jgi:hypothetical protein
MSRINLEDPIIERPIFKGAMKYTMTRLPDAAAALDVDMGPVIYMVPTAGRILTLPIVTAAMKGTTFIISSGAAFALTVNNFAGTLVGTAASNSTVTVICTGEPPGAAGWILA